MNSELAQANWFKSTRSGASKDCVEVAFLSGDRVGVRDSKNPAGPALVFDRGEWDTFTAAVAGGAI
ncbi:MULTISPECIES: DUF397 domain-containing protein [Nocardia]|uniref:DUF397 domain-containing protein n=1 Tax=Nocardia arthritidis TaxID=228602 RepID=A0A6G9YUB3_9NOCA|nr:MULTISPECIES: DUF397 domain-containing protein [Nocardia]QIS16802.1 DUF397 domain-containing protein [Nocardia arthritidis]